MSKKSTGETGKLIKPEALKSQDRVAVICPASRPASEQQLRRLVFILENIDLRPVTGRHALSTHGYLAGTDNERLDDLMTAVEDDSIRAVFFATGGYGSLRLLDKIDYSLIRKHPKIYYGFDDNTALLLAIHKMSGLVCFHGPDPLRLSIENQEVIDLRHTLSGELPFRNEALTNTMLSEDFAFCPVEKDVEGRLTGGNLTALMSLQGTKYQPHLADRILFLCDRDERDDILERWLTSLYVSGQLATAAAVLVGDLESCDARSSHSIHSACDMFADRFRELGKPSMLGVNIGTGSRRMVMPIGVMARLELTKMMLTYTETVLNKTKIWSV